MRLLPLVLPAALALAACSSTSGSSTSDVTAAGGSGGSGGAAPAETCTATFRWLQKDAYKETAGRSSSLWPPHTTTTLDVVCSTVDSHQTVASAVMANHGTKPDAVDANGDVILVEMKREDVEAPREALLDLVTAYEACACEPTTKFLSLDSLQDTAVQALLQNVAAYLEQHLTCPDPGTSALVASLQQGDFDAVLGALPSCTWEGGSDLASGLDEALDAFLAASQEALAAYHVCNNDAKLQAGLWADFRASKSAKACDSAVDTCRGPAWFYAP